MVSVLSLPECWRATVTMICSGGTATASSRSLWPLQMTGTELAAVLTAHEKWRRGEDGGMPPDLKQADLRHASQIFTDLSKGNLSGG